MALVHGLASAVAAPPALLGLGTTLISSNWSIQGLSPLGLGRTPVDAAYARSAGQHSTSDWKKSRPAEHASWGMPR